MIIEYSNYDIANNDTEIKNNTIEACRYNIKTISVNCQSLKTIRSSVPDNINISCPIDYPLGTMDSRSRNIAIEFAIKNGASEIDLVIPTHSICNRKYDKFREDVKTNMLICQSEKVNLRYMLEYRVFTYEILYKISQILLENNVTEIYPSTGYSLDDINDNLIASAMINKKVPSINIISNGNVWNQNQVDSIKKAGLYGIRVNSINALRLFNKKNNEE